MTSIEHEGGVVETPVVGCARCGMDHGVVFFKPLQRAINVEDSLGPLTHFAPCPMNNEPILMQIVPLETPDPEPTQ